MGIVVFNESCRCTVVETFSRNRYLNPSLAEKKEVKSDSVCSAALGVVNISCKMFL